MNITTSPYRPMSSGQRPEPKPASSGSVDRITLNEGLMTTGAAAGGALLAGLGGAAVTYLGGWGIPAAIAGEAIVGGVGMYMLVRGAHDGSAVGGNTMVGVIGGAVAGGVGSLAGGLTALVTGSSTAAIAGGAVAGALAAGGFAGWLALNN
jgi:hypothetical protein